MVVTAGSLSLRAGSLVCGRYAVGEQSGHGRFSATDTVSGLRVELQVLGPRFGRDVRFQEQLLQAVRSVSRLDHPNVAAVRDWDRIGDQVVVVSDTVSGTCLTEEIERSGALDPETVHRVLGGVTAALEHAHANRVVHGDISTDHVWITPQGGVVLSGFGLAALMRGGEISIGETDHADATADMYALGRLSYQMMCGRRPSTPWRPDPDPPEPQPADELVLASARLVSIDIPLEPDPEPDPEVVETPTDDATPIQPMLDLPAVENVAVQRRRKVGPWPVAAASFVLLLMLAALVSSPSLRSAAVPAVAVGAPSDEAERVLSAAGFDVERRLVWSESEAGTVVGIDPEAGTELRRGSSVELVVSRGPRPVTVASVVGMALADAQATLSEAGLEAGEITEAFDESVPAGRVVSQSPADGTAPRGSAVHLVVSKGPEMIAVPSLTGQTLEEATAALAEAGLVVGKTSEAFHATGAKGTVVSQKPASGTLRRGGSVDLVISKGQDLVAVPETAGKTRGAARKALSDAGFKWAERTERSDAVAEGTVIRSDPAQGRTAPRGSTVTLVVSSGPPTVVVPNVVGMSRADAKAKLSSVGLSPGTEYAVPGSGKPAGEVQGQDPAAGTRVQRGSRVNLYYSA